MYLMRSTPFLHAQRASYPNLIRHQGLKHFEPGRPAGRPTGRPEPIRLRNYRFGAVFFGFATGSFPLRLLSIWCRQFFSEKSYFCIFSRFPLKKLTFFSRASCWSPPQICAPKTSVKNAVIPRFALFYEEIYIRLIIGHHPIYMRISICLT